MVSGPSANVKARWLGQWGGSTSSDQRVRLVWLSEKFAEPSAIGRANRHSPPSLRLSTTAVRSNSSGGSIEKRTLTEPVPDRPCSSTVNFPDDAPAEESMFFNRSIAAVKAAPFDGVSSCASVDGGAASAGIVGLGAVVDSPAEAATGAEADDRLGTGTTGMPSVNRPDLLALFANCFEDLDLASVRVLASRSTGWSKYQPPMATANRAVAAAAIIQVAGTDAAFVRRRTPLEGSGPVRIVPELPGAGVSDALRPAEPEPIPELPASRCRKSSSPSSSGRGTSMCVTVESSSEAPAKSDSRAVTTSR